MRRITITLLDGGVSLSDDVLGRAGEVGAVQLVIDYSAIAQEGVNAAFLRYRMPDGVTLEGEAAALPETGPLTVTVPAWAMSERGCVQMQLTLTGTDKAVRSYVWSLRVLPSLEVGGTPPEAVRVWLAEVEESIEQALEFCAAVGQMSVTAQTLEAGAAATASGSISAQEGLKLAFGLPTGAVGPKGDKGAKGDPGTVFLPSVSSEGVLSWSNDGGLTNPQSANIRGPKGETGAKGDKGETGPQGIAGPKGDTGATGAVGPKGDTGAQGIPGAQGEKGDTGAPGATFIPAVSTDGTLSWSNDGGLTNPAAVNVKGAKGDPGEQGATGAKGDKGDPGDVGPQGAQGPKGDKGDTGAGFAVLDYYASLASLQAGVAAPSPGDAYGVGTSEPYDIYIYGAVSGWVNNGPLQGAPGASGATFIPSVSADGLLSWSNDGGLTNPASVSIRGPKGDAGVQGSPGAQGEKGDTGTPGATFIPSVAADGLLSWSNDGGLSNPAPVSIKGPKGDAGTQGSPGAQGEKGDTGAPGATFVPSVSADGLLSWSNNGGISNPASVNIKGPKGDPGAKGSTGAKGDPGAVFTPTVSSDGLLSWSNNGGLSNPASVSIKGPKGDTGPKGATGSTGPQGPAGTATALSVTLPASGWSGKALTASAAGVTAGCHLIVTPAPSCYDAWCEAGVRATSQGSGTLTFGCTAAPAASLTANVLIVG